MSENNSSTSLVALLSSRLEGFHCVTPGVYQARCPACALEGGDKSRNHLRIWTTSGAFRCAKIAKDAPGDAPLDHNRIIRAHVYQNADPALLAALESQILDPEPKLEADKVYHESMLSQMLPDHRYWVGRGISEAVLRRFEGAMHPDNVPSKMAGRYLFPIRDYPSGRIVGWTGRLVQPNTFAPKWKHLCRSSRVMFPLTVTAPEIKRLRKVVLVESPGDALALAEGGIWCLGILLGLNLNSRWLGWLASVELHQIVISTNNDNIGAAQSNGAGNKAAEKLRAKLVPFFGEERVVIRLPNAAKDWGDTLKVKPEEIQQFKAELEGSAPSIVS